MEAFYEDILGLHVFLTHFNHIHINMYIYMYVVNVTLIPIEFEIYH